MQGDHRVQREGLFRDLRGVAPRGEVGSGDLEVVGGVGQAEGVGWDEA